MTNDTPCLTREDSYHEILLSVRAQRNLTALRRSQRIRRRAAVLAVVLLLFVILCLVKL